MKKTILKEIDILEDFTAVFQGSKDFETFGGRVMEMRRAG